MKINSKPTKDFKECHHDKVEHCNDVLDQCCDELTESSSNYLEQAKVEVPALRLAALSSSSSLASSSLLLLLADRLSDIPERLSRDNTTEESRAGLQLLGSRLMLRFRSRGDPRIGMVQIQVSSQVVLMVFHLI